MKIDNFKLTKTEGFNALTWVFFAEVDVTTGILFWKKTEKKIIARNYAEPWYFVSSGDFTPGTQCEDLARSWKAKTGELC